MLATFCSSVCAHVKVMMEELSTLATGFEVDGGQLRYQLYVWLEKEVEVLKVLCNYGQPEEMVPGIPDGKKLKGTELLFCFQHLHSFLFLTNLYISMSRH